MSANVRVFSAFLILCAAACAFWWLSIAQTPANKGAASLERDLRSGNSVEVTSAPAILRTSGVESAEPKIQVSILQNRDALITGKLWSANHSSPEAMRFVGNALRACSMWGTRPDIEGQDAEARRQFSIAQQLYRSTVRTTREDEALAIAATIGDYRELLDFCEQLAAAQTDSWAQWLGSAALIGDTEAMRDYIKFASQDLHLIEAKVSNPEGLEQRALVRRYSEYILESGDCSSLGPLSSSVDDDELALSYQLALVALTKQNVRSGGGNPAEMAPLDNFLADRASHFTDVQWQSAQSRADYVLHNYCGV